MTNIEYLNEKVLICFKHLNELLIPKEQIIDIPVSIDMINGMEKFLEEMGNENTLVSVNPLSPNNCTYCLEFFNTENRGSVCEGCPMFIAGNRCNNIQGSYLTCTDIVFAKEDNSELAKDLIDLAERFIESNQYLLERR